MERQEATTKTRSYWLVRVERIGTLIQTLVSISKERRNVPLSGSDGLFAIAIGMAGKKPALGKRGMADHMHAPNQSV